MKKRPQLTRPSLVLWLDDYEPAYTKARRRLRPNPDLLEMLALPPVRNIWRLLNPRMKPSDPVASHQLAMSTRTL